jgi:energy-coupling factor transport system ATP-binding protein
MMPPNGDVLLTLRDWSLTRRDSGRERPILSGIDLELRTGRWLAVLGANGSGKSSLLKFLASEDSPLADSAAILFQDPDDQIIAGTVEQELSLGREGVEVASILEEFGLVGLADLKPLTLSAGQKQRLALAVALAGRADLLLCDEPTALQDAEQAGWVLDRLDAWRREPGRALVTATCDRDELARADDLMLFQDGKVALAGPVTENLDHPLVSDLLGGVQGRSTNGPPPQGDFSLDPILELSGVGCRFLGPGQGFFDVDLSLRPGARVGITGENGCGKSTLLGICAGVRPPDSGRINLAGTSLYDGNTRSLDHGVALLAPQFPEYLFTRSTVAQEIDLDPGLAGIDRDRFLAELGLPSDLLVRNPHDLSTGQKRRLALGLVVRSGRPVVLLDEPTAALDRAGRQQALELLAGLPESSILLVASHDQEFLAAAGCRVLVLTSEGLREE